MLSGKYVNTFADASHALPQGMHMNADYPFMLPPVVSVTATHVTLKGRDGLGGAVLATAKIHRGGGREWCELNQSSGFEKIFGRSPTRFRFHPFKDENTPAVGGDTTLFPLPPTPPAGNAAGHAAPGTQGVGHG